MSLSYLLNPNNLGIYAATLTLSSLDQSGNVIPPLIINEAQTVPVANLYAARAVIADNFSGNITGDATLEGYLSITANAFVGTSLVVTDDATIGGNIIGDGYLDILGNANIDGNLAVGDNLTVTNDLTAGNVSSYQFTSTAPTGVPPLVVASTTQVTNLKSEFSGTADVALGLKSATTTVSVSAATAPTAGQVLTATNGTTATWVDPTTPTGNITLVNVNADSVTSNVLNVLIDASISGDLVVSNIESSGYIDIGANLSVTTNVSVGTSLSVGTDASVGGNVQVTGWIDSDSNISATGAISTASQLISTVATGTAPLVVSSTTQVTNLKSEFSGTADVANALKSATTTINVSSATAPTSGQVLTATSGTAATWQTPGAAGSGMIKQIVSNFSAGVWNSSGTIMDYTPSIPVITDGTQVMALSITPTSASSYLKVEAQICYYAGGGTIGRDSTALFKVGTTNALTMNTNRRFNNNEHNQQNLVWYIAAGSTSSQTFTVRAGNEHGYSMQYATNVLPNTYIMITEYLF